MELKARLPIDYNPFKKKLSHPRKKVLILEGGGMRGIFPTGVLQAFTDRGYFPWRTIIGSSAGALTGTVYASGQIHIARDSLFTTLLSGKFIHLSNVLKPDKHILDLDWMVDTVIGGNEPLDFKKLKQSCPVFISAAHCSDNKPPETIFLSSKKDDVITALKASSAIPFLYRGFVNYRDYHLLDGGLLDPIPYKKALSLGYKEEDILIVTTRPKKYRKKEESFWIKSLYERYYNETRYQYLVESMENRYLSYNRILDELEGKYKNIDIIYPPNDFKVDRLTQDEKKILEGFEHGVEAAKTFLYPPT
ncbi:MAG: patatin family protein [bacterium]|nr:patatin family protein [bacterium]